MKAQRSAVVVVASAVALVAGLASAASAVAASGPVFTVMNTSESAPDGVYYRDSPHWSDTSRTYGLGVFMNEQVQLLCYQSNGDSVGPYNDSLWYYTLNVSRPTNFDGQANQGMLNAHYINDGQNANVVDAGVPACVNNRPPAPSQPPGQPSVTPCVFDMSWSSTALTFSYGGNHRYLGNAYQAAHNWTDLGTGLTVNAASGSGNIRFVDFYSKTSNFYAQTEVPLSWRGPASSAPYYNVPYSSVQTGMHHPSAITIKVNQYYMDKLSDFARTYVLTHEMGHALGLGHSDTCTTDASLMRSGGSDIGSRTFNKPQYYDRIALEELYGLPRR